MRIIPHVFRDADLRAIEEESKQSEMRQRGKRKKVFVVELNADLLGGTESAL